jgi:Tfp pilus assembly protein PilO
VTYTMERILAWKLLPRAVMAVMLYMYVEVLRWFMAIPQDEVSTQATALTATVTGAISGAFAVWLGHEK